MIAARTAPELRYLRLSETAPDGILIVDPATREIVDVNPLLIELLGFTREEFIGKELFEIDLIHDEAASRSAFPQLQVTGSIRYENLPLQTKDGRSVEVEFVSNMYREGDQEIMQCNIYDITARNKTERALQAADLKLSQYAGDREDIVSERTAELRISNAQLETFVYSSAQDLRGPLRHAGFRPTPRPRPHGKLKSTGSGLC